MVEVPVTQNPRQLILSDPPLPSYLFLRPSKNPATPLVASLLDATNYHSWSMSMIIALSAKNKVKFILGTTEPQDRVDSSFFAWHRCNNMVALWLIHLVSTTIHQSVIWMDKTFDIGQEYMSFG